MTGRSDDRHTRSTAESLQALLDDTSFLIDMRLMPEGYEVLSMVPSCARINV